MSSVRQVCVWRGGLRVILPPPFVLLRPSVDGMMPTHTGEANLLHWVPRSKCESHLETPSQTPRNDVSSGHPVASQIDIKLTIANLTLGNNQNQCHYMLVFQKCSKVSHIESPSFLLLIGGWLCVSNADILHISVNSEPQRSISVLFTTRRNHWIKDPTPKAPEPIQKTYLSNFVPLEPYSGYQFLNYSVLTAVTKMS